MNTSSVPEILPRVSVIIPCRNEKDFIAACLSSLCDNDYPGDRIEIIVVDGNSTDETLAVVEQFQKKCPQLTIISNPAMIFPAAVNAGFRSSTGDVIIIAGAHAVYAPDYISQCVKHLYILNADNTGGVLHTVGRNNGFMPGLISSVLSSSFGVGNATFRTGSGKITETDTVFGGCYRREVFDRIGGFNENLVSTSDMDFNTRLRRSGGKIFLIPSAVVTYYTRTSFAGFFKNNFRNGFWAVYPLRFTRNIPVSLRHFIPLIFVTGIIFLSLAGLVHYYSWLLLAGLMGVYFLAASFAAMKEVRKGKLLRALLMPFMFLLLHLSYGSASLYALLKVLLTKRKLSPESLGCKFRDDE